MNHDEPITLASLNLHGGLTGRGAPFDVAQACYQLKADVITLQEAWRPDQDTDEVTGIAATLGAEVRHRGLARTNRAWLGLGPDTGSGTWGLAMLSLLPVTGYQEIELGQAPGDRISRAAQVVTLTMPGGAALRVVNTHLTHRFTSPVQLALLTRRLAPKAAAGPMLPTVIVGDLNMPRLLTRSAAGYRATVRGRTYPADRPWIQLDQLLFRGPIRVSGAEVAGPVGSDHLPIRAQLSVR